VALATGAATVTAAMVGGLIQSRNARYQADAESRRIAVERRSDAYENLLTEVEHLDAFFDDERLRLVQLFSADTSPDTEAIFDRLRQIVDDARRVRADTDRAGTRVLLIGTSEAVEAANELLQARNELLDRVVEPVRQAFRDQHVDRSHMPEIRAALAESTERWSNAKAALYAAMRSDKQVTWLDARASLGDHHSLGINSATSEPACTSSTRTAATLASLTFPVRSSLATWSRSRTARRGE
jgi:hypothetical protein